MSEDARKLFEVRREQWHRLCRGNLLACATALLEPRGYVPARHHELFCHEIEAVVRGQTPRLILISPRGSAKSTYASHIAPAWLFAMRPEARIVAVSHTQEMAEQISRAVMRFVRENSELLGYDLANDAAGRWSTTNGCEYRAVGVGQPARGSRADLIVVDDPIRSRAEAESETARNSLWEYFHSDLLPCLLPRAGVVLIATAYHEMDLMCRLEREQADLWRVLRLPAISEGDGDPLDRPEGEPLWADDAAFGYGVRLLELQAEYERYGRGRDWASQFQGRPRPPEGAMFRPQEMPIFDALPGVLEEVRAWDLASSLKGDWTVGLKLGRLQDWQQHKRMLVVTDIRRMRGAPDQVRKLVQDVAASDGYRVKIWLPKDPAQAGADQADSYIRMLRGYRVQVERMSGDKVIRADAAASQANIGQIGMLRASWNAAFIDELASFPSGQHDDQIDALSLAFNKLGIGISNLEKWIALST